MSGPSDEKDLIANLSHQKALLKCRGELIQQ